MPAFLSFSCFLCVVVRALEPNHFALYFAHLFDRLLPSPASQSSVPQLRSLSPARAACATRVHDTRGLSAFTLGSHTLALGHPMWSATRPSLRHCHLTSAKRELHAQPCPSLSSLSETIIRSRPHHGVWRVASPCYSVCLSVSLSLSLSFSLSFSLSSSEKVQNSIQSLNSSTKTETGNALNFGVFKIMKKDETDSRERKRVGCLNRSGRK